MKKGRIIFIGIATIIFGLFVSCSASRQTAYSAADEAVLIQTINSGTYMIQATSAFPASGTSVTLDPRQYYLKIEGSKVVSNLPYWGNIRSAAYGTNEGLAFEGQMRNYKVIHGKNNKIMVSFGVRTKEDSYSFQIDALPGSETIITVIPNNKESIRFTGVMVLNK